VDVFVCHILEEGRQIDPLLIVASDCSARGLADDREHRSVIELCVVEAIEEVNRARPGRGDTDAELTRELRMARRHERSGLPVASLYELKSMSKLGAALPPLLLEAVERSNEAVNPVARVPKDGVDAPIDESLKDEIGDGRAHCDSSPSTDARH